ncbi:unnamed protein product [Microthlaspi erraticum]|uniref:NYN domain-containing protein n=1 Tax=Microthlaspi erraticum TaxID=1685480 RepID=A0A6D2LLE1_9BRAS|nr:unnamed protein product [Microthlaspi erraticum]
MGEEDLTKFSGYRSCETRQTRVFWDLVKYPIPASANLEDVEISLKAALYQLGLYSCETIVAYGDRMNHSEDDLRDSRILHLPQGQGEAQFYYFLSEMAVDILYRAHNDSPLNIMVIPRPDTKSELHRVLRCLQSRHHNILLVNPGPHAAPFLFNSVSWESIVKCTEDLDGGKPIMEGRRTGDGDATPVIKDARSLVSLFESVSQGPGRTAFVFWDVNKYSKPTEANILDAGTGIREALQRLGHHGCVEILAFGADILKQDPSQRDFYKEARIIRIPHGLYTKALDHFAELSNPGPLMVIPTPDRDDPQRWVLKSFLQERHCDVLSVEPPADVDLPQDALFLHYPNEILACTEGVYEGRQITRGRRKMKDIHEIQDFSKPITFQNRATPGVFVFWNLEDFPFPTTGWTPDKIYQKIDSAFPFAGYELSIWAYVKDEQGSWGGDFLTNKTWESSIYFLPGGGDKSARHNRMLHDIFLWKADVEPDPANLFIVANVAEVVEDDEFSSIIDLLQRTHYKVSVVPGSFFEF